MLGRVVVAAILSLLLAASAFSQCNLQPVASAQFRSTIFDLAVDGGRLWAATGYGLTLYDPATDPPTILDTIALPGPTRVVRTLSGVAYAASGSTIQVVQWDGRGLQLAGAVEAGAAINDLAVTPTYLYAATTSGIVQFDLINAFSPAKTSATFATSSANVAGLALSGDVLYAADGDSTVEVFSITVGALPAKIGAFASLARPVSVAASDGRLYVSDGQQTDVFLGTAINLSRAGTQPFTFGSTSFTPLSSTAIFAAGADRRLRAFDMSSAGAPVEIFRAELAPTSGSVNRINALALFAGRLYAGAGDIGLITYDVRQFNAPFPARSYGTIGTNSVVASAGRAYFGRAAGAVEYAQSPVGGLTELRSWDKSRADAVQDVDNDFLLTTSGASATMWALTPSTPTLVGTATFSKPVSQAVLAGTTAFAVLDDHTLWTANLALTNATPQKVALALAPQFIARSGSTIAVADLRADGTTAVATVTVNGVSSSATVQGLATAGLALSGNTAAVWTFRGLTLISFPSGTTTQLPQSASPAPSRLALSGTRLVETTDSGVIVWDTSTQRVTAQITLPSAPTAVTISPNGLFADVALPDGVAAVQLAPTSHMPSLVAQSNGNFFAKKLVSAPGRLVLFDGRNADILDPRLAYRGGIHANGTVDVAANAAGIYTLTNTLGVRSYTRDGEPLAATIIADPLALPLSIAAIDGAVFASIVRGCPLNCEKKTVVLDPKNALGQTVTITGAIREIAVSGARAAVLTELPDEIRVLDVSDPAHPRELAKRASEGTRLPTSIAYENGTIYVLGEKLFTYDDALNKLGEPLGPYVDDLFSGVTYADQHIRVEGGCLAFTGRSFSAQLGGNPASPQTPSAARDLARQQGRLYVLTDHSLEVWGAQLPSPPRRRAAR